MKQIKIFTGDDTDKLDTVVNKWLTENVTTTSDIVVTHSTVTANSGWILITIVITYTLHSDV